MINIEGRNPVIEALKSDHKIKQIYLKEGSSGDKIDIIEKEAHNKKISLKSVSKEKIEELTETGSAQGVIAVAGDYDLVNPDEILETATFREEDPFVVILDQIQDPHNFGAIIRSACAAGAHGVLFPKDRSAAVTPAVIKASAGAVEHIKLSRVTNINYLIENLKEEGLWIVGADVCGHNFYYENDLTGPLGVVIGNEGYGLRRLVKENCDFLVKIPMAGAPGSLNASVAAGIIIYDIVRQRKV